MIVKYHPNLQSRIAYLLLLTMVPAVSLFGHGTSSDDDRLFMVANLEWTLVHEFGHALISELNIPVLGKQEDAADQIATIALLVGVPGHWHDDSPLKRQYAEKLRAVAHAWQIEWELTKQTGSEIAYWDSHSLDIQRFYTILCLVYGSDPDQHSDLIDTMTLPYDRAWTCEEDYAVAKKSAVWISDTYRTAEDEQRQKKSGTVGVVYESPGTDERQQIFEIIKNSKIIEAVAEKVGELFLLPRNINVVVSNCLGEASAYWRQDLGEIVFCYELLERFLDLARFRHCLVPAEASGFPATSDSTDIQQCLSSVDEHREGKR